MPVKSILKLNGVSLTQQFSLEEIKKKVVWDCDNFKSSYLDGINFGFLKEFWEDTKEDFMRFFICLHIHGRLVRDLNNIFIVIVPRKMKL